jgi:hypothetical protein
MPREKARRALREARRAIRLCPGAPRKRHRASDRTPRQGPGRVHDCSRHDLRKRRLATWERHHIAGRRNSGIAVLIPARIHRVLSDMQNDWPEETLRNPQGDILHVLAAWSRSASDIFTYLAELMQKLAKMLEALAWYISTIAGPGWWRKFTKALSERDE